MSNQSSFFVIEPILFKKSGPCRVFFRLLFILLAGIKSAMAIDYQHPLAVSIRKKIVKALAEHQLLGEGDKLMVCVSGGKDSSLLVALLEYIRQRSPYRFELEAVLLDQKQPGFEGQAFQAWMQDQVGVKLHVLERDTYSIVKSKITEGTFCSLCSRLRRAILYDFAVDRGFSKMALGHHRDDFNQTLLLNLFYSGKLSGMPAKLLSDDERNIIIRPLMYVAETELIELAQAWEIPVIPCNLCGSQENLKRKRMKQLLTELSREIPHIHESMLTAQANLRPSQLLDHNAFDFNGLEQKQRPQVLPPEDPLLSI